MMQAVRGADVDGVTEDLARRRVQHHPMDEPFRYRFEREHGDGHRQVATTRAAHPRSCNRDGREGDGVDLWSSPPAEIGEGLAEVHAAESSSSTGV